jgi:hypothetical protein
MNLDYATLPSGWVSRVLSAVLFHRIVVAFNAAPGRLGLTSVTLHLDEAPPISVDPHHPAAS